MVLYPPESLCPHNHIWGFVKGLKVSKLTCNKLLRKLFTKVSSVLFETFNKKFWGRLLWRWDFITCTRVHYVYHALSKYSMYMNTFLRQPNTATTVKSNKKISWVFICQYKIICHTDALAHISSLVFWRTHLRAYFKIW